MNPLLGHAQLYASFQLPMIPVFSPNSQGASGKVPTMKSWQHKATFDMDIVKTWFANPSTQNLGIATGGPSGLLVLDIDPRNRGEESLIAIEDRYGKIHTPLVHTGGGGYHFYFKATHPMLSRSNVMPGVDIKADAGFVVAPPSMHSSGNNYRWGEELCLEKVTMAPVPEWLMEQTSAQQKTVYTNRWQLQNVILPGHRNASLTQLCGHLLRREVDAIFTYQLIHSFNKTHCNPPLNEAEVTSLIDSICKREQARRLGL